MKKHFLLLMMAFFSLTGWAADLSKGTIIAYSPYYGQDLEGIELQVKDEAGNPLVTGQANEVDNDYTIVGYFREQACTNEVTFAQILQEIGETFWIKITGANGYENDLVASFKIKKMPLTVTFTDQEKTYGDDDDEPEFVVTDINEDVVDDEDLLAAITIGRNPGEDVIEIFEDEVLTGYGDYKFTATLDDDKYSIGAVSGGLTINPKDFIWEGEDGEDNNVSIKKTAKFTYNGQAQEAKIEISDIDLNSKISAADYDIEYANNVNASVNEAIATITPKRNYTAEEPIMITYSIAQAPLLVTPAATKVYDGDEDLPDYIAPDELLEDLDAPVTFTYQGFVDDLTADDVEIDGDELELASESATANVGTYTDLTITEDGLNAFSTEDGNYKFIPQTGIFSITQLETLEVTVEDVEDLPYGQEPEYEFALTEETFVDADEDALMNALKVVQTSGEDNAILLTVDFKSDAEIDAAIDADVNIDGDEAKAAAKAAAKYAKANYALVDENITKGTLTTTNASMMIALKESAFDLTKVYDGQDISIALPAENLKDYLIISPANAEVNLDDLTLTVVDNDDVDGTANVGTYRLELDGAVAANYDITYVPSQYKITARPVAVQVFDQTFLQGDLPTVIQSYKVLPSEDEDYGFVDEETDVFKVVLITGEEEGDITVDEVTGVITADPGEYEETLDVAEAGEDSKFDNYRILVLKGTATILDPDATIVLNRPAKAAYEADNTTDDAATVINEANGEEKTVTFGDFKMYKEKWYPIVLPFATSVKEVSEAFGYAIVNILNASNTDETKISFKLWMGDIEANTPFVVKVYEEMNMNEVVFEDKEIVESDDLVAEDASHVKFIGSYSAKTDGFKSNEAFFSVSASKNDYYWGNTGVNKTYMAPLSAYFQIPEGSAARIIEFEEADGTVTAIQAVNVKTEARSAEGWYTIGGTKLQGAPTQKGVYIQNGKKVIVK